MKALKPSVSYFAKTNYRNSQTIFGIEQEDRIVGMYIIGKTGAGKTNLIETLLLQDIYCYRGACIFDIAGDLTKKVRSTIPVGYREDLIWLDTTDHTTPYGYNPLRKVPLQYRHLVTSHILEVFEKIWGSKSWGTRIEYILRNVLLTLLDQESATFSDVQIIFIDEEYRTTDWRPLLSKKYEIFGSMNFPNTPKRIFPLG